VILKVRTHTREVLDQRNSKSPEFGLIADAGLHQNLRRVTGATAENDLTTCGNAVHGAEMRDLDVAGALAVEHDAVDGCVGQDREVFSIHARKHVGTEHRLALSVPYPQVGDRCAARALHHAAVLVLENRNAHRSAAFEHGRSNGVRFRCRLDKDDAAGAAIPGIGDAMPILNRAIDVQNRSIAPGRIGNLGCKEIPV
jgi:hypothetical protein